MQKPLCALRPNPHGQPDPPAHALIFGPHLSAGRLPVASLGKVGTEVTEEQAHVAAWLTGLAIL